MAVPSRALAPFDELYARHAAFVFRTVRGLGVPPALVDDAVQDVFVVAHRRLPDFDGSTAVKPWLYAIARRVAHDVRRSLRRKGSHEPLSETLHDPGPDALAGVEQLERLRLLEACLDTLDDEKREVLVLAEIEQMSSPEIAEVLNIKLNTVYSRLRRARHSFDQELKRRGST